MKVVVTGALGHIGSALIRVLPDVFPSHHVLLIDNLLTQRYYSLFNLPCHDAGFRFLDLDILKCDLDSILEPDDVVVHLAAITDAANSFDNSQVVEQVNVKGTERIALHCGRKGCKLLYFSSTSVYGTQDAEVDESCSGDELRPQSPYAQSKLESEALLFRLGEELGLRYVVLRFGTVFGVSPGMRFHTAINKFVWQACLGQPITVWRTAIDQKRPYLDLRDAVRAILFAIEKDIFNKNIYNVLTLNSTVRSIVDAITELVPDLRISFVDERIMNQLSYCVSNRRISDLGFDFQGDLSAGIRESVQLFNAMLKHRLAAHH